MAGLELVDVRALFAQEAEGRLANLGQLLLRLEDSAEDDEIVRSVFRELHTLKGSSAVAGLVEVSRAAHELEEVVEQLRSGQRTATPELIDGLLAGVDRLAAGIAAAVADGDPADPAGSPPAVAGVRTGAAGEATRGVGRPGDGSGRDRPVPPTGPAPDPYAGHLDPVAGPSAGVSGGAVAVPTERLDELTRMIGESASAHLRVGRMLKDRFGLDPASCSEYNELSRSLNGLQDRAMRTRMVPVATITDKLRRAVRDLARSQGKKVRWDARGTDTELDRGSAATSSPTHCSTSSATPSTTASSRPRTATGPGSRRRRPSGCTPCSSVRR